MSLVGTGLLPLHVRVPPVELPSISVAASSTGIPLVGATFPDTFTSPPTVLPPELHATAAAVQRHGAVDVAARAGSPRRAAAVTGEDEPCAGGDRDGAADRRAVAEGEGGGTVGGDSPVDRRVDDREGRTRVHGDGAVQGDVGQAGGADGCGEGAGQRPGDGRGT